MNRLSWLLILIVACHSAVKNGTRSGSLVHPQRQLQPPITAGSYKGITRTSAQLNIVPINDSLSYFKLAKNEDSNSFFCEGIFKPATGTVTLFSDPLVKARFSKTNQDTISVTFPDLFDDHYYNTQMAGAYYLVKPNVPGLKEPSYRKWEEWDCLKDDSLVIYHFPDTSIAPIHSFAVKKGDVVKLTHSLAASQISPAEVFYFVTHQEKSGWTIAKKMNRFFEQQYRCELMDDRTIYKENRRERYVLYVDDKGRILKKETY